MIKRFYVNNFRCLEAFELKFDSMSVFCGANGTGKSSCLDALLFVRDLAVGNCFLGNASNNNGRVVSSLDFCYWSNSKIQEFELEFEIDSMCIKYLIHIEQKADFEPPRVIKESVICDNKPLFQRELDGVHLTESQKSFPLDWRQSALAIINPVKELKNVEKLKNALKNLLILRPNVRIFESESLTENQYPNIDLSNIISWYRSLYEDQEWASSLKEVLSEVWPEDFKFINMLSLGSAKSLILKFTEIDLQFDKLSDGEKMLIALYMLYVSLKLGKVETLFIDEPDNFVALQELQPWLLSMSEIADKRHQFFIISHNPEILNGSPVSINYFFRDNHSSPTRIKPLDIPDGLIASEALAMETRM